MAQAGDEIYDAVKAKLIELDIDTLPEVQALRIPGERRYNTQSPTAGTLFTIMNSVRTTLGRYTVSRKRIRRDALRLFKEGQLA